MSGYWNSFRVRVKQKDLQEGCVTYKVAPIESKNWNYMQSLHCSVNIGSEDSSELKPPKGDSVSPATVSSQGDNSSSEFPALGGPSTPWILWAFLPGYSAVSPVRPFPRSANRSPIWETDSGFLGWFPSQSLWFPIHLKWVHLAGSVFGSFWK